MKKIWSFSTLSVDGFSLAVLLDKLHHTQAPLDALLTERINFKGLAVGFDSWFPFPFLPSHHLPFSHFIKV